MIPHGFDAIIKISCCFSWIIDSYRSRIISQVPIL
jgi:hypothetical protein